GGGGCGGGGGRGADASATRIALPAQNTHVARRVSRAALPEGDLLDAVVPGVGDEDGVAGGVDGDPHRIGELTRLAPRAAGDGEHVAGGGELDGPPPAGIGDVCVPLA